MKTVFNCTHCYLTGTGDIHCLDLLHSRVFWQCQSTVVYDSTVDSIVFQGVHCESFAFRNGEGNTVSYIKIAVSKVALKPYPMD